MLPDIADYTPSQKFHFSDNPTNTILIIHERDVDISHLGCDLECSRDFPNSSGSKVPVPKCTSYTEGCFIVIFSGHTLTVIVNIRPF